MAGVIKSKGNQVFTAQVRSINTDTGSGYVTEALQRANARISDSIYRQAVDQQKRAGQEFARNQIITSVKDPDGTERFVNSFGDLSQVARDTARPLIERKYAAAFNRDVEEMLIAKRQESRNSTDFETLASVGLQGLLDAVPPEFEFAAKDTLENSGALSLLQHKQSMVLTELRQERQAAIEAQQSLITKGVTSISTLVANGDLAAANEIRRNLLDDIQEGVDNGPLTDQFQNRAIKQIEHYYYGSLLVKDAQEALFVGDEQTVFEMINALEGNTSFTIGDEDTFISELKDTQDITFDETRKVIASDIRRTVSNFSGYLTNLAKRQFAENVVTNLEIGNYQSDDAKSKTAFGDYWAAIGVTQDRRGWLSKRAVALVQDQQGTPHKAIVNGNFLPPVLEGLMNGIASGNVKDLSQEELEAAVTIYQTVTQGVGRSGDTYSDKGLSDETVTFFDNIDEWINTFGIGSILQGGGIYAGKTGKDRNDAIEGGVLNKLDGRNANGAIITYLREEGFLDGLPGEAAKRLLVIARPAYGFLSKDIADKVVKNAIDRIYTETSLIRMPEIIGVQGPIERSEFAPERFYGDNVVMHSFLRFAHKRIESVTGNKGTLGEDLFLYPSRQSTNRRVRWFVIDANGQNLPNSEGRPLLIDTMNVNKNQNMRSSFDAALEKKLADAQKIRDFEINEQNKPRRVFGGLYQRPTSETN